MFFIYALAGVLCLGLAPLFGKFALTYVNPLTAFALRTIIAAFLVTLWFGYHRGFSEIISLSPSFWLIITIEAILAALLGDLAYFYALKNGNINEVSIIMSCAPLITIFVSYFSLNEGISTYQLVGTFFITIGLILISVD
jgi:transporter family protein